MPRHLFRISTFFLLAPSYLWADPPGVSIYQLAKEKVALSQFDRSSVVGFSLGKNSYAETFPDGGILVGFDVGLGPFHNTQEVILSLRPILRTELGEQFSENYGAVLDPGNKTKPKKITRHLQLSAKQGYAVAGLAGRSGLYLQSLQLVFMKIQGAELDSNQSYSSEEVGNITSGRKISLSTKGSPVVGVFGTRDPQSILSVGFQYLKSSPEPPKAVTKAAKKEANPLPKVADPPMPAVALPIPNGDRPPQVQPDWQPPEAAKGEHLPANPLPLPKGDPAEDLEEIKPSPKKNEAGKSMTSWIILIGGVGVGLAGIFLVFTRAKPEEKRFPLKPRRNPLNPPPLPPEEEIHLEKERTLDNPSPILQKKAPVEETGICENRRLRLSADSIQEETKLRKIVPPPLPPMEDEDSPIMPPSTIQKPPFFHALLTPISAEPL